MNFVNVYDFFAIVKGYIDLNRHTADHVLLFDRDELFFAEIKVIRVGLHNQSVRRISISYIQDELVLVNCDIFVDKSTNFTFFVSFPILRNRNMQI